MKKLALIIAIFILFSGCHTFRFGEGDDPRPPQMNNDPFTNFTPMVINTNVDTNIDTNTCVEVD